MLIAKIILIFAFVFRLVNHIKQDEAHKDKDVRLGARLATATIFIVTCILYYFAGIFNFTAQC